MGWRLIGTGRKHGDTFFNEVKLNSARTKSETFDGMLVSARAEIQSWSIVFACCSFSQLNFLWL